MNIRSSFRNRLLTLVLVPAVALAAAACGTSTAEPVASAPATSATVPAPTSTEASTPTTVAARAKGTSVKVFTEPDAAGAVVKTFGQKTALGSRTTLVVVDQRDDWLKVSLPTRPNGSTGWVRAADVELRSTTLAISVDRANHHLVVTNGDDTVLETTVAVGTAENPTPAGTFYVTDLVQTDDGNGAYGPFALGLSGHSETLTEFAGGDGQLAVHGTNDASSIGHSVSHGCVRVPNDVVTRLAQVVALGTPVTIG